MASSREPLPGKRPDSWKEIAAFLGRAERTVKRWESERGLPVHRVPGGGRSAVFAYANELADWLKGRSAELDADDSASPEVDTPKSDPASVAVPLAPVVAIPPPRIPAATTPLTNWPAARLAAWIVPLV